MSELEARARLAAAVQRDPTEAHLRAYWRHLMRAGQVPGPDFSPEVPGAEGRWLRGWRATFVLPDRVVQTEHPAWPTARLALRLKLDVPGLSAELTAAGGWDQAPGGTGQPLAAAAPGFGLVGPAGWAATQGAALEAVLPEVGRWVEAEAPALEREFKAWSLAQADPAPATG